MVDPIGPSGGFTPALPSVVGSANSAQTFSTPIAETNNQTASSTDVVKVHYTSPVTVVDPQTQIVIYEYRDPGTGKITQQYPSAAAVKAYKNADQKSGHPLSDATVNKTPAVIKAAPAVQVATVAPIAAPIKVAAPAATSAAPVKPEVVGITATSA